MRQPRWSGLQGAASEKPENSGTFQKLDFVRSAQHHSGQTNRDRATAMQPGQRFQEARVLAVGHLPGEERRCVRRQCRLI